MRAAAAAIALSRGDDPLLPAVSVRHKSNPDCSRADNSTNNSHLIANSSDDDDSDNDSLMSDTADEVSESAGNTTENYSRLLTGDGSNPLNSAPQPLDFKGRISPLHNDILNALRSSACLSPLSVEVHNLSYWYRSRKQLGPRKQNATIVKVNSKTNLYEAYIYKMKV